MISPFVSHLSERQWHQDDGAPVLRGWLVFHSEFLPRFLGVLSIIGGTGWLTWLWPPLGSQVFTGVALFAIMGVIATSG